MNARQRAARVLCSLLAATLVACASADPPLPRTAPMVEDRALRGALDGRYGVLHRGEDLTCEWLIPFAEGSVRACLVARVPTRPDPDLAVVPETERSLLVLRLDGTEGPPYETSFSLVRRTCATLARLCRPDEQVLATWKNAKTGVRYRKVLALSPDGRSLALVPVSTSGRIAGYAPPAPEGIHYADRYNTGALVIVDLASGAQRDTGIRIVDEQPITWSADGRRLLVVRPEPRDRLTAAMRDELRGREGLPDGDVPVIESIDVADGSSEMLAVGFGALWSPDGRTLVFAPGRTVDVAYYAGDDPTPRHDRSDAYEVRDLVSGARRDLVLPGLVGPRGPIAFVGPRQLLYWALPKVGTKPPMTTRNSPLVGPKQTLSLRAGDIDTGGATTLEWFVDPRAQVGYANR